MHATLARDTVEGNTVDTSGMIRLLRREVSRRRASRNASKIYSTFNLEDRKMTVRNVVFSLTASAAGLLALAGSGQAARPVVSCVCRRRPHIRARHFLTG